jgi:tetratricopeptide (TPR) repeat protein
MVEVKTQKVEELMTAGEFDTALDEISTYLKNESCTEEETLSLSYLECEAHRYLGKFEDCVEISRNLQKAAIEKGDKLLELDAMISEVFALYRLDKLEEALNLIKKAEAIIKKSSSKQVEKRLFMLNTHRTHIYIANGEFNQAYVLSQQNNVLCQKLNDPDLLARAHYISAWVYVHMGNIENAIEFYMKSLELREKQGKQYDIAHVLFGLGYAYRHKGELDKAFDYFQQSREIREKIGNKEDIVWTLLNIGDIMFQKGEIKAAQEYYDNTLIINRQLNFTFGIIFSLLRLSSIYKTLEDPQLALDTLNRALEYARRTEMVDPEFFVLIELVLFITEKKLENKNMKKYLNRLKEINSRYQNKIFDLDYRLAYALTLKSQGDIRNKRKARLMLQEITHEEIIDYNTTRIAMINYIELLAEELEKHFGSETFVSRLTKLSDSLTPSRFQQSYSIVAESFIDQSRIALEDIDISTARALLQRAQLMCDFLELYNKGPTPFRILYLLLMKERSLNDLKNVLNITKGALSNQLKLLLDIDLVKVSKEEQVRSSTMLKKYYTLGSRGREILQSFTLNICESVKRKEDIEDSLIEVLFLPRLKMKMLRDFTYLIDNYQDFLEERVILGSIDGSSKDTATKKGMDAVQKQFTDFDEIKIDQHLLTEEQYEKYLKLRKEFDDKFQKEILEKSQKVSEEDNIEKPKYIAHISLPIKEMITFERYMHALRKDEHNE